MDKFLERSINDDRDMKDFVERYVNNNNVNDNLTPQGDGNSKPDPNGNADTYTDASADAQDHAMAPNPAGRSCLSQKHGCTRTVKTPRDPLGRKRHGARRTVVEML
jgi:hypothetical protein